MTVLTLHTPDGDMAADLAGPTTPNGAGVVVIQEAFGVTGYVRSVADRLAAAGYLAIAPHVFHRSGDPIIDYADFSAAAPHMSALTADGIAQDLDAAISALAGARRAAARDWRDRFLYGRLGRPVRRRRAQPSGPRSASTAAASPGTDGAAPAAGRGPDVAAPWLGQYGDDDPSIPASRSKDLRARIPRRRADRDRAVSGSRPRIPLR